MNLRKASVASFAVFMVAVLSSLAAEGDPAAGGGGSYDAVAAIKRFRAAPGLKVDLVAAEPLLQNVVSFSFDGSGRAYVVETHRRRTSVFDIRGFPTWLDSDYSFRTVEDRAAFYRREVSGQNPDFMKAVGGGRRGGFGDFNNDGKIDWHDLEVESERIRLLTDADGDGKFDKAVTFADGFNSSVSGVAAGVLAHGTNVWFTCIPDLWKFTLPSTDFVPKEPLKPAASISPRLPSIKRLHGGFGVHIAFGGHDMHGLKLGPDGKLYWSVADRGADWRPEFASTFFPEAFLKNLLPDTGAIFRCDPDGSNIEVVAVGLRNPQELAFDDFGNLWTGDNNADGGDKARLVYVLPGGDSGWRIGWQWQTNPKLGAWNSEGLWWNVETNTGAYLLPTVGHVGKGPAGLAWYPGTGMPDKFNGHFLMCDFPDGVRSFSVKPRGAGFAVASDEQFLWNIGASDVDFAPGGGAYVLDWGQGWEKSGKGRLYRVADDAVLNDALVKETKQLLTSDFSAKPVEELGKLLGHRDQRVRLEAQWALAAKEEIGLKALAAAVNQSGDVLPRLHGLWGLGQIARKSSANSADAKKVLRPLLTANIAQVRGQAAKVLGELKDAVSEKEISGLLSDASPRVRSFAAIALGQIGVPAATPQIITMLRDGTDPWLRHAAVMGLVGCATSEQLAALAKDESSAVRLAAVLALRRRHDPALAGFLADESLRVRTEAMRAIYDEDMTALFPALALSWTDFQGTLDRRSSRAISPPYRAAIDLRLANVLCRLGTAPALNSLAQSAADSGESLPFRVEALTLFSQWPNPPKRDRVTGHYSPAPAREISAVPAEALESIFWVFSNTSGTGELRAAALNALAALKSPKLTQAVEIAKASSDAALKKAGVALSETSASTGLTELQQRLEKGTLSEQQSALAQLGKLKGSETLLAAWLDKLAASQLQPELALDVKDAAAATGSPALKGKLDQLATKQNFSDPLAAFRDCLTGGDIANGRKVFVENQVLGCQRCHSIQKGDGGEVGPLLGGVGSRLSREQLLESILLPNAKIAAGFENVVLTLKNGQEVAGMLKKDSADALQVLTGEEGLVTVPVANIKQRDHAPSSMIEGLAEQMTRRELRDLVEFLSSLK